MSNGDTSSFVDDGGETGRVSAYSRLVVREYNMKGQRPGLRERRFQVYKEVGKSEGSSCESDLCGK